MRAAQLGCAPCVRQRRGAAPLDIVTAMLSFAPPARRLRYVIDHHTRTLRVRAARV